MSMRRRYGWALAYFVIALPLGAAGAATAIVLVAVGGVLSVTPIGLWLLALAVRYGRWVEGRHRTLLGVPRRQPAPTAPGIFAWRRAVLADRAGWQALGYTMLRLILGPVFAILGLLPLAWGGLLVVRVNSIGPWVVSAAAGLLLMAASVPLTLGVYWLERRLLAPGTLSDRVRELEKQRTSAVDDAAATVRRIERDLHDGTQARLVGLGITLAMVKELLAAGTPPEKVNELVEAAQADTKDAIVELRELVRGIHPPILDRGLEAAVRSLAARGGVPVEVTCDLPDRVPPAVESMAYFCAAELLTNLAKHSGAARATVDLHHGDGRLRLRVRDDGHGGAALVDGGGLAGLAARAHTVDGSLTLHSPAGGPTEVTVQLPTRR
jgi:signal transduction histidine kinase